MSDVGSQWDAILVPRCFLGHWTLYAFLPHAGRFQFYNPLEKWAPYYKNTIVDEAVGADEFVGRLHAVVSDWGERSRSPVALADAKGSFETLGESVRQWPFQVMSAVDAMPQQTTSYDCGVFVARTIEHITRGFQLNFCQSDMAWHRHLLLLEFAAGKLLRGAGEGAPAFPGIVPALKCMETQEMEERSQREHQKREKAQRSVDRQLKQDDKFGAVSPSPSARRATRRTAL